MAVPDLVGLAADEAEAALEDAGLTGEASEAFDATVPAGTVVSQEPAPDTELAAGSAVSYVVSAGPAPVAVPDLVGLAADEAEAALEDAGLTGERLRGLRRDGAGGHGRRQEPAPDTELAAGSAVSYVVSAGPAPVAVPDLVGLAADEAEAALEDAGLTGEASEAFDATVPAGTVVSQEPAPDTELAAGSAVSYVVSAGPAPVAVPDLVGLAADEAEAALEDAGLTGERLRGLRRDGAGGHGRQPRSRRPTPSSPRAPRSATSSPPGPRPWPCPTSWASPPTRPRPPSRTRASPARPPRPSTRRCRRARSSARSRRPTPSSPRAPRSATSSPPGPRPWPCPTSWASPPTRPRPPSRTRASPASASEAFDATVPAGTVVSQEPAPDTELAAGSAVSYVVSAGPAPVAVPDLVGLAADEAEAALEDAGLTGEASEAFDATVPAGTVVCQEPAPDTELAAGSAVSYVVSAGPAPVAVPDLVGLQQDEATSALGSASLAVGTISNAVDDAAVGEVIAQDPLSGTEVPPGSSIDLVVSAGSTPVEVPDVRDLPESDAVGVLEDAGLVVADTQTRSNGNIAAATPCAPTLRPAPRSTRAAT